MPLRSIGTKRRAREPAFSQVTYDRSERDGDPRVIEPTVHAVRRKTVGFIPDISAVIGSGCNRLPDEGRFLVKQIVGAELHSYMIENRVADREIGDRRRTNFILVVGSAVRAVLRV